MAYKTYEDILNQLPNETAKKIESMSSEIDEYKRLGNFEKLVKEYKDTLRGYIVCLRDCGFLNDVDMRRLITRYVQR